MEVLLALKKSGNLDDYWVNVNIRLPGWTNDDPFEVALGGNLSGAHGKQEFIVLNVEERGCKF
jgi:hypothetical protein